MQAGTLFSLTRDEAKGLFAAAKSSQLVPFIYGLRAPADVRSADRLLDTGGWWIILQKCFTMGGNEAVSAAILRQSFAGGRVLHRHEDQVVSLLRPDMVPHVAKALAEFSDDDLLAAFGRLELEAGSGETRSDADFQAVARLLAATREFYGRAAEQGSSILFAAGF